MSYRICVVRGILPMIALVFLIGIIGTVGTTMGSGALAFSIIFPWVGLTGLLIAFFYGLYIVLQPKRTWYYLTNQRLLEVRGRSIVKEIPRMNLKDLDPKQFIRKSFSHKSRGDEYFNFSVTDPVTGVVITMTAQQDDIPDIVARWVLKGKV